MPSLVSDEGTDYGWRIRCRTADWARAVAAMAEEIDYPNCENRIASQDPERAELLAGVWSTLLRIQANEG
jgi:hypothetical protein